MSSQGNSPRGMNWERLARAETHELRISVLEVLSIDDGRTLSPKELAYELQTSLATVNYHTTVLCRTGILRLAHEHQVGGAMEHFYCLADHSAKDLFDRI